ncbi:MAG TPA: M48 family metalloprotease [Ilumatobacteraceae bacterium]|nr:M48 family metalloprotease [Ilumatobacteraceae bacterium]
MTTAMRARHGARSVERGAIWAFMPVVAILPFSLLALFVVWLPIGWLTGVRYGWLVAGFAVAGLLLFVRPIQVLVLTPLLRGRRPTAEEAEIIEPLWSQIAQANGLPTNRYVVRVLPTDELNAFACGGHLVLVTSFAVHNLSQAQLRGVLAHELSHHLGLHTVAITIGHWLSTPVVLLARVGFFLENVGHAAAGSFGQKSPAVATIGSVVAVAMHALSWIFTAALRGSDALANLVGHSSEFEADRRAVRMGFGRELASALRELLAHGTGRRPIGWRARLAASHPPARTRVARIEALMRHPAH